MKRVFISFLAGMLFMIGASAVYAEVASMIGKKVDGQLPLKINGKLSEVPAITIDGVSYIPLRAAGELFGYKVSWIDGEIFMEKMLTTNQLSPEELAEQARIDQERAEQEAQKIRERNRLNRQIEILNMQIQRKKNEISELENSMASHPDIVVPFQDPIPYKESEQYQRDLAKLEQLKEELAALESELAELERKKAELEAKQ